MLTTLLIFAVLIVLCSSLAFVAQRWAAKKEAPKLSAPELEQDLRGGFSPSVFGALVGIVPYLIFVIWLVVLVITAPPRPTEGGGEGGGEAAAHS